MALAGAVQRLFEQVSTTQVQVGSLFCDLVELSSIDVEEVKTRALVHLGDADVAEV